MQQKKETIEIKASILTINKILNKEILSDYEIVNSRLLDQEHCLITMESFAKCEEPENTVRFDIIYTEMLRKNPNSF